MGLSNISQNNLLLVCILFSSEMFFKSREVGNLSNRLLEVNIYKTKNTEKEKSKKDP